MGGGPVATAINLRVVEHIDIASLRLKPWNGLEHGRPPIAELPGIALLRGIAKDGARPSAPASSKHTVVERKL